MQHIRGEATIEPSDICNILAIYVTPKNKGEQKSIPAISEKNSAPMQFDAFGYTYYHTNVCHVGYHVSSQIAIDHAAIIDQRANVCMVGEDMKLIETGSHIVNVTEIEDHQVSNLPFETAAGLTHSQYGNVIIIVY